MLLQVWAESGGLANKYLTCVFLHFALQKSNQEVEQEALPFKQLYFHFPAHYWDTPDIG